MRHHRSRAGVAHWWLTITVGAGNRATAAATHPANGPGRLQCDAGVPATKMGLRINRAAARRRWRCPGFGRRHHAWWPAAKWRRSWQIGARRRGCRCELDRDEAGFTPPRLDHKSFTVSCPLALLGSAFYAPRFLPTFGHPRAVALALGSL